MTHKEKYRLSYIFFELSSSKKLLEVKQFKILRLELFLSKQQSLNEIKFKIELRHTEKCTEHTSNIYSSRLSVRVRKRCTCERASARLYLSASCPVRARSATQTPTARARLGGSLGRGACVPLRPPPSCCPCGDGACARCASRPCLAHTWLSNTLNNTLLRYFNIC